LASAQLVGEGFDHAPLGEADAVFMQCANVVAADYLCPTVSSYAILDHG